MFFYKYFYQQANEKISEIIINMLTGKNIEKIALIKSPNVKVPSPKFQVQRRMGY